MKKDYYKILGVEKKASDKEIRSAYKKLAIKYHPDRNPGNKEAEEKFKEVAEAYEILKDETKRKNYDMFGDPNASGGGFSGMDDIFSQFMGRGGNPFGDMFGHGFNTQKQKVYKGTNRALRVTITIEELYRGGDKAFGVKFQRPCHTCGGKGSTSGLGETICPHCGGTGQIIQTQSNGLFTTQQISPCPHCNGEGYVIKDPCPNCNGMGLEEVEEKVLINIPPFERIGQQFVIAGKGNSCFRNKGANGDLIYVFNVVNTNEYTLDGLDIVKTIEVPVLECITGEAKSYEHIDKRVHYINIPQGCKDGEIITCDGVGFRQNGNVGKLKFLVKHKMPTVTNEALELINKLKTLV